MSESDPTVRIHLGHASEEIRSQLRAILESLGHEIAGISETSADLVKSCKDSSVDLIVSGTEYPDGDGIEALVEISTHSPIPSIVVTRKESLDRVEKAMDDHVMAYLIEPVEANHLKPTIYVVLRRFSQFQDLKKENKNLKEALATRKKVERAKGILMKWKSLTEEEAYLLLRNTATRNRQKMEHMAQMIIDAEVRGILEKIL